MRWLGKRRQPRLPLVWVTDNVALSRAPRDDEWTDSPKPAYTSWSIFVPRAMTLRRLLPPAGLEYRRVPIEDFAPLPVQELAQVAEWIAEQIAAGRNVLVHCREGRGRSPMVACATLVKLGHPLPQAFEIVRRAQPAIALTDSQIESLETLASNLREG